MSDDLEVAGRFVIPAGELHWTFGPSGGPGGQHANRSQTRAELRFDLAASTAFPPPVKEQMLKRLRVPDGILMVVADETRSQWRNREAARRRLAQVLAEATVRPRARRPTRPSAASKERRVRAKRHRAETKRMRRGPEDPQG